MATQQEKEALLKTMQEIASSTNELTGKFCKLLGVEGHDLHSKYATFVEKIQKEQQGKGQSPDFH